MIPKIETGPPSSRRESSRWESLQRLAKWVAPYKITVGLALVTLVVAAAAELAVGQAVRYVVDNGFAPENEEIINRYFAALLAIVSVFALATFGRIYMLAWIGERIVADVRKRVYSHVIGQSASFFEVTKIGELTSRLTADTMMIQTALVTSSSIALRSVFLFIGGIVLLFLTSEKLATIVFLVVPFVVIPLVMFGRRVRRLSRTAQNEVANFSSMADESFRAVQTVHAYTHEDYDRALFASAVEKAFRAAVQRTTARASLNALIIFLIFGLVNIVLWIGARDVIHERMTAGELTAFVFYSVILATAVGSLSEIWGQLQQAAGATERIEELLNTEPEIRAPINPVLLPRALVGEIEFENVSFDYPSRPDKAALESFSLTIQPGETVALVGPSGSGKSTVFRLLLRYFDPQLGRIKLDGVDITHVDPTDLRKHISLVSQDPVIFGTSAAENIRYGRPDASDEEVHKAAHAAAATGFIQALPQGFASHLGEYGVRLSGGQRQRIAIARAILRNTRVLLFDEATSALDSENERLVKEALERISVGRTAIVIAHRLASVRQADRIVVMNHGRIVATGTHDALMQEDGLYAQLARLQLQI
jgi:ATP-binding cassette, subfamily B, bacterial